jgi:hypothetical protein
MKKSFLVSLAIIGALSTSTTLATAPNTGLQVTKPTYQWKTETNKSKEGFDHCLVKNMYDNGTIMILAQNKDSITRLALHFPQDKMQPNQQFDLTIQIDKGDVFPVEAVAVSPQILTIGIPEALPDLMRKGEALYLRGPTDEVVFLLSGVDGAVSALRDCVTANISDKPADSIAAAKVPDDLLDDIADAKTASSDEKPLVTAQAALPPNVKPVENSRSVPKQASSPLQDKLVSEVQKPKEIAAVKPPAPALPAPKKLAEITKEEPTKTQVKPTAPVTKEAKAKPAPVKPSTQPVAKVTPAPLLPAPYDSIMTTAKLMPERLLLGKTGQAGDKPLDYAWRQNNLFVGIKKQPPLSVPAVQLPQLVKSYLAQVRGNCAGEFVAEAGSFDRSPTHATQGWVMAEIACASPQAETIGALLFYSDAAQTTIYFVESAATNGSDAIKARNTILKAVIAPNSLK